MKRNRVGLWVAGVGLLAGAGVLSGGAGYAEDTPAADRTTCSVTTLKGTYLLAFEGVRVRGNDRLPFAGAGYEVYDGAGKVNAVISVSENGEIARNVRLYGTYTVNRDCTSTVTYPETNEHFDQFVAPDGSMFTWVQTDRGVVLSAWELRGTAKRVGD
jgi:hypothetical protein